MANLLIEIGTEELPQVALRILYADLARKVQEKFVEARLKAGEVTVEGTPRRIVIFLKDVPARQENQDLEFSGPSYEKSYKDEKPTKALEGFLKAKNASLKDVQVRETPKGKFIFVQRKEVGNPVAKVLPELIEQIIASLSFPKLMRWEPTSFRFPRPIRWMIVLLDKKIIRVKIADVTSSNTSYGHRFLAPKAFKVLSADLKAFTKQLKIKHVILSIEDRKALIRKALKTRFHQIEVDEELILTNAVLTEEPFFLKGLFSKTYLDLPAEVLASCMKKNQKIFAIYDAKGKLMNHFVAVLNGKRNNLPRIKEDYENVLESRLKDARYFYVADTKEPFESKLELLQQIVYLGKLGTMRQKVDRMQKLAEVLAPLAGHEAMSEDLKRVARLAKIDLMTQLVFEFPDLQGIVGREYAEASGEKKEVAAAIGMQYLPKNLSEKVQRIKKELSPLGALFGIIDRLDLVVGAFGIGLEPTGSQDPFALRRAGGTIVKLVRAFGFQFSLDEVIDKSLEIYGDTVDAKCKTKLYRFFNERTAFELQVKPGTREMEIFNAVWNTAHENLADVFNRYQVLTQLAQKDWEKFRRASKVVERTGNIVKGAKDAAKNVDPQLLEDPLEKQLFALVEKNTGEMGDYLNRQEYAQATVFFGQTFYAPLHAFFDKVMVNVEDPAIRQNRQALMRGINRLYTERLADLSVLSRLDE